MAEPPTENVCHLLVDPPAGGPWNMALDEALLEASAAQGGLFLRFYSWLPATLSLGYFQSHADRAAHAASVDCPLVRRPSGGGAIVHDRELTYALVVPAMHPRVGDAASLYNKLEHVILPMFRHDRPGFIDVMRHCIAINGSFFNTQRMMHEYVLKAYFR